MDVAFGVGVHEAIIADPETTGNYVLKFILELECILETVIVFVLHWFFNKVWGLFRCDVISYLVTVEWKEVEIIFKS